MSKLTLPILHAYAAVGAKCSYLDCQNENKRIKATLTGASIEGIETTYSRKRRGCNGDYISHTGHNNRDLLQFRIDLRPLSSLTKPLKELDGKTPLEWVKKEMGYYFPLQYRMTPDGFLLYCEGNGDLGVEYQAYQKLLSLHMDIFGLLESGDALPIDEDGK